ncbi:Mss4-like protein [Mycena filopes]|nr:Mss4-like protein [Mycena filopes]
MASTVQRLGSCLCTKVRFTVQGEPFTYALCHCINCRKFAGSAFMTNAFFSPDKVTVTEGEDFIRRYQDSDTTSGNTITRSFCSECGTSLFLSSPTKPDWMSLCPSAVGDPKEWVPRRENRPDVKLPWITGLHMEPKPKRPKL